MFKNIKRKLVGNKVRLSREIHPDEVLMDSSNLPDFNIHQFEGRIERPISLRTLAVAGILAALLLLGYGGRVWALQVVNGDSFAARSESNRLKHTLIFAERGVVTDRTGEQLAWNTIGEEQSDFPLRRYSERDGLAHVTGYLSYPQKDKQGFYYTEKAVGKDGAEKFYDALLSGENGLRITETDALGKVASENVIRPPKDGQDIKLAIDAGLTEAMHDAILDLVNQVGFTGGAGVMMDVHTGEVVALTSYPEYDPQVMTDGKDREQIRTYLTSKNLPFLDRVIDGLYAPGSIVKPFMAIAALTEKVITPEKQILSTGELVLPNPYDPDKPSIFKDWKAHGWMDMKKAIAVSSNVYFYEIGGGFEQQQGLGIERIARYMDKFGFGRDVPEGFFSSQAGIVPTPAWKAKAFEDGTWRIGDTYHTSIGQFGWQVTSIQAVRAIAALANSGTLLAPSLLATDVPYAVEKIEGIAEKDYVEVREGMRESVLSGTASGLNIPEVKVAGKTGTAEIGASKQYVNSWSVGFFPYENPKYAYMVMMERGPRTNTIGATAIMRHIFDWMKIYRPEYLAG